MFSAFGFQTLEAESYHAFLIFKDRDNLSAILTFLANTPVMGFRVKLQFPIYRSIVIY